MRQQYPETKRLNAFVMQPYIQQRLKYGATNQGSDWREHHEKKAYAKYDRIFYSLWKCLFLKAHSQDIMFLTLDRESFSQLEYKYNK